MLPNFCLRYSSRRFKSQFYLCVVLTPRLNCFAGRRQQEARRVGRSVQDRPGGQTPQGGRLQLCCCQGKSFLCSCVFFVFAKQVQLLCFVLRSCLIPGEMTAMVRAPTSSCDIWGPYEWLHMIAKQANIDLDGLYLCLYYDSQMVFV